MPSRHASAPPVARRAPIAIGPASIPAAMERAHAQKNALTVIEGLLSLLDPGVVGPTDRARFELLRTTVRGLRQLTLDDLGRTPPVAAAAPAAPALPQPGDTGAFDLGELAAATSDRVQPLAEARGLVLRRRLERCVVVGNEVEIAEAMLNLALNAVQAGRAGGEVWIETAPLAAGGARYAVSDTGPGFDPAAIEPGTRRGDGHGLGLSIARRAAEQQGGALVVEARPGGGVRVELRLAGALPARPAVDAR